MEPRVHELNRAARGFLVFLLLCGAAALVAGALALFGVLDLAERPEASSAAPAAVLGVIGLALLGFPLTVLPHARLMLDAERLTSLGLKPWGTTRVVRLADVRRYGVGQEVSDGRDPWVLVLELADGSKRRVRVSNWRDAVERLGELLEQEPAATREGRLGTRFDDDRVTAAPAITPRRSSRA